MKKGILLINIGTPEAPTSQAVRKYLIDFLDNRYVIELPTLFRKILVRGIIAPFRAKKSAKRYQKLWTDEGSPLLVYLNRVKEKLQNQLNESHNVYAAMICSSPYINDVIKEIEQDHLDELIVVPLFPHHSKSTTDNAIEMVKSATRHWNHSSLNFVPAFYKHPLFIKAIAARINEYRLAEYDHLIFSYHSLPIKQINKERDSNIERYDTACYQTSKLIAEQLNIASSQYSTAFQSRLTNRWLGPFTPEILDQCLQKGEKKILVITPSFVADCLETTIEVGQEYRDLFLSKGGEKFDLVSCVNDSDLWIDALVDIVG